MNTHLTRLLVILSVVECCLVRGWASPYTRQPNGRSSSGRKGAYTLIHVRGDVKVQRGSGPRLPARTGKTLQLNDLLWLGRGAQATVLCPDLSRYNVQTSPEGIRCPKRQMSEVIYVHGYPLRRPKADEPSDPQVPIVLSPRKTRLLNRYPVLRWSRVSGTQEYEVVVTGGGKKWRQKVGSRLSLIYPQEAPGLVPGTSYAVDVNADGYQPRQPPLPELGFVLLTPQQAEAVRASERRVRALHLSDPLTRFLVAQVYAVNGLYAEAIAQLEGSRDAISQEPNYMNFLGDLYLHIELNPEAEEWFLKALSRSQRLKDVEGQATAFHRLGLLYDAEDKAEQAADCLWKAVALYQQLKDSEGEKQVRDHLTSAPSDSSLSR